MTNIINKLIQANIIKGSNKSDNITGTSGKDVIIAGNGKDNVTGGDGKDLILGGNGKDTIDGGGSSDLILGGNGNDTINGGAGNDLILGGNGKDIIDGGADNDTILAGNGNDIIIEDISTYQSGKDCIDGGNGVDTLRIVATQSQINALEDAIAAFMASNKKVAFDFGKFLEDNGGDRNLFNVKVVNVENIEFQIINANADPTAQNDTASVSESIVPSGAVDLTGNVLTNDTDPDADTLNVTSTAPMVGTYGTLVIQSDGSYAYTFNDTTSEALEEGEEVHDIFNYSISDGNGGTSSASLDITITGTNDAPVAISSNPDFSYAKQNETVITAPLLANVTDVDHNHTLSIFSVSGDPHISLMGGDVIFDPGTDFAYLDEGETAVLNFSYVAQDEHGAQTDVINATLTVTGSSLGQTYIGVGTGDSFSLGIRDDGTAWSWGTNVWGVLGINTIITPKSHVPVQIITLLPDGDTNGDGFLDNITQITGGAQHALALREDGTAWAWGRNSLGQLGDGTTIDSTTAIQVKTLVASGDDDNDGVLDHIVQVDAGTAFSLALRDDGTVWSWGLNNNAQLGDGTLTNKTSAAQVLTLLGGNGDANSDGFLDHITQISAGYDFSLAVRDDGTVWAWGYNFYGQLGYGTSGAGTNKNQAIQVQALITNGNGDANGDGYLDHILQVSGGVDQSLAVRDDGTVWAWGRNTFGQLGDGTSFNRTKAIQVQTFTGGNGDANGDGFLDHITQVSGGSRYSLALRDDGTVWSWGYNGLGYLGDGTQTSQSKAVQVQTESDAGDENGDGFLDHIIQISTTASHSLALRDDGTVWSWGFNSYGQLGDGIDDPNAALVFSSYAIQVYNVSLGTTGNDVLIGTTGNDTLIGGLGNDSLTGGLGVNTFVYDLLLNEGNDTITDFSIAKDILQVSGDSLANILATPITNNGGYVHVEFTNGSSIDFTNIPYTGQATLGDLGMNIDHINSNPTVQNDTASVSESIVPSGAVDLTGNVLTNDTDPDGDTLNVTSTAPMVGTYGTLVIQSDGSYAYTFNDSTSEALEEGEEVHDIFNYSVSDGNGGTSSASLDITITGTNDAPVAISSNPDFSYAKQNETVITAPLLANVTDVDHNHTLGIFSVSGDPHISLMGGDVIFDPGTDFAYLDEGETAVLNFSYVAQDEHGAQTDVINATLTVTGSSLGQTYIGVGTGDTFSLALQDDGTVWSSGHNDYGQLGIGTSGPGTDQNTPFKAQTSVGNGDANGDGFLDHIAQVAAGYDHSLAVRDDGTVWSWGSNAYSQLGDGTTTNSATATEVRTLVASGDDNNDGFLDHIIQADGGRQHSLAVRDDGTVWSWGYNISGQLGDGTTGAINSKNTAVQVQTSPGGSGDANGDTYLDHITQVSGGGRHSLAVRDDGTVWSWGDNGDGELGDSTLVNHNIAVQVTTLSSNGDTEGSDGFLDHITQVSGGDSHSLALRDDGTVWAWGQNNFGQLGDGTTGLINSKNTAIQVKTLSPYGDTEGSDGFLDHITQISSGPIHSLALRDDGTVWSWGANSARQLGDGTTTNRSYAIQVRTLSSDGDENGDGFLDHITQISAGGTLSLALRDDGTIWSWGQNTYGQLGNGTTTNSPYAIQVYNVSLGTTGNDVLIGTTSNDTLIGRLGNDSLTGGLGINTFVFDLAVNEGQDTITDFAVTKDVLQFSGDSLANVMATSLSDNAGHVHADFANGSSIDFTNITYTGQATLGDLIPASHIVIV